MGADDGEAERYGKAVNDLQSNVSVVNGAVTGTLAYVTGYTGFSDDPDLQEGNYLALAFTGGNYDSLTAALGDGDPVDISDGFAVIRIADKTESLVVTGTNDGGTESMTLDLSGLTLEE